MHDKAIRHSWKKRQSGCWNVEEQKTFRGPYWKLDLKNHAIDNRHYGTELGEKCSQTSQ